LHLGYHGNDCHFNPPKAVDFFKMATVAMKMVKMLKKNEKHKKDHSRLLAKQKLMKFDRNNIHS
jgi:hypothetical protein